MIVRVLYLLLRQRFDQWRSRTLGPKTVPSQIRRPDGQTADAATVNPPVRRPYWIVLVVGVGALVFVWHQAYRGGIEATTGSISADLTLQVQASNHWPLAVYLTGDDLPPPPRQALPSNSGRIESVNARFVPMFQVLPVASELEIINSDPIAHNTHVFNRGETIFNVGLPTQGIKVRKTLTGSGIFSVRCDLHTAMRAWLFVPPSPHYAVIDKPQTVGFVDLPPGEYVLHLWQADGSERHRLVSLAAGEKKTLHLH